jgi:hypothetical protein
MQKFRKAASGVCMGGIIIWALISVMLSQDIDFYTEVVLILSEFTKGVSVDTEDTNTKG